MADDKIRYVLDVDDKGSPKLVKFGTVAETSGKKASKSFKGASEAIGEVAQRIPGAGAAMDVMTRGPLVGASVAVAGLAAGFGAMVMSSINAADHINDLSLQLGVSTERLSVLKMYAEQSGTTIEMLASKMARFGAKVASGDKTLKAYGVTANSADEALFQLADKVAATTDPMMRLRIATDAFGKSGQEMLPLLVQGGAALREMGDAAPIVSTEMARMADDFNDRMVEIKGMFTQVGFGIAEKVLPELLKWAEGVDRIRLAMGMLTKSESIEAGRRQIVAKYADLQEKQGPVMKGAPAWLNKKVGTGTIEGKTLQEALADYDKANAPPPDKAPTGGGYGAGDGKKGAKKAEDDRVKAAFDEEAKIVQARFNLQKEFEAQSLAAEEERSKEGIRLNALELKTKSDAQKRFEDEKNAAAEAAFQRQMNYANQLEGVLSSSFASALRDGTNLWSSLGEGFKNMLIEMAAQMAARAAIFGLFDMFTGGAFGAATGGLSNYVFRAGGGPYEAGDNLITQERRAEAIIPRGPGRVAPTAKGGDTINIIVQNPAQAYSTARQLRKDQRSRNTGIN